MLKIVFGGIMDFEKNKKKIGDTAKIALISKILTNLRKRAL